jgi:hypothetical protein
MSLDRDAVRETAQALDAVTSAVVEGELSAPAWLLDRVRSASAALRAVAGDDGAPAGVDRGAARCRPG